MKTTILATWKNDDYAFNITCSENNEINIEMLTCGFDRVPYWRLLNDYEGDYAFYCEALMILASKLKEGTIELINKDKPNRIVPSCVEEAINLNCEKCNYGSGIRYKCPQ